MLVAKHAVIAPSEYVSVSNLSGWSKYCSPCSQHHDPSPTVDNLM